MEIAGMCLPLKPQKERSSGLWGLPDGFSLQQPGYCDPVTFHLSDAGFNGTTVSIGYKKDNRLRVQRTFRGNRISGAGMHLYQFLAERQTSGKREIGRMEIGWL